MKVQEVMHLKSFLVSFGLLCVVFLYGYKGDAIGVLLNDSLLPKSEEAINFVKSLVPDLAFFNSTAKSAEKSESITSENEIFPSPNKERPGSKGAPNARFGNLPASPPKNVKDKQGMYFERLREQVRERRENATDEDMMDNEPEEEETAEDEAEEVDSSEPVADPYAQFKRPPEEGDSAPKPFVDAEDSEEEEEDGAEVEPESSEDTEDEAIEEVDDSEGE